MAKSRPPSPKTPPAQPRDGRRPEADRDSRGRFVRNRMRPVDFMRHALRAREPVDEPQGQSDAGAYFLVALLALLAIAAVVGWRFGGS